MIKMVVEVWKKPGMTDAQFSRRTRPLTIAGPRDDLKSSKSLCVKLLQAEAAFIGSRVGDVPFAQAAE